jgi:serine phosphatase RsbU (regulator of sigma subunit)
VESSRQRILTSFIVVILIVVVLIAFVLIRQNRIRKKANEDLSKKNKIIQEQHKDITDSIKYSKRIQEAILPPEKMWYDILPKSFLLYKPKDILSGDFYWVEETADYVFLAAADCTGHGVPGALMSIVNYNLLNKAVLEKGIYDPGEILTAVNMWLTHSLHQTYNESSIKDGMDVSLVSINKKTNELKFAGAFNSLYLYTKDGFVEIRGDKFPVGAFIEESMKKFTTHTLHANSDDQLYIFTDGFADQFGGPKGKKFKSKNLKKLFAQISQDSCENQFNKMEQIFTEWKGNLEQIDDICIMGVKV